MSEENSQERTEQATPKRIKEAREKGQAPRSRDLTTFGILFVGSLSIFFLGPRLASDLISLMRQLFQFSYQDLSNQYFMSEQLNYALYNMLLFLAPFFLLIIATAIIFSSLLNGLHVNFNLLAPKFNRLNPFSGFKRMFGLKSFVELCKSFIKFLLLSAATFFLLYSQFSEISALSTKSVESALSISFGKLSWFLFSLSIITVILVALDVPYQIWEHIRQLKMTKQEIRDEYKETEGKPEVKAQIRRAQTEIAKARMMTDVPKADVIITNPTHYSVAIKYLQGQYDAPRVIAKGQDLIAFHIRDIAEQHRIPVVSSPALARSIYYTTKVNHEIPKGLYLAVAQVLSYVYQLRQYRKGLVSKPKLPSTPQIPEELRH